MNRPKLRQIVYTVLAAVCVWWAGYLAGVRDARPADMLCVADDRAGNAVMDLYGPDGTLWSTARIPMTEPISTLFPRSAEIAEAARGGAR